MTPEQQARARICDLFASCRSSSLTADEFGKLVVGHLSAAQMVLMTAERAEKLLAAERAQQQPRADAATAAAMDTSAGNVQRLAEAADRDAANLRKAAALLAERGDDHGVAIMATMRQQAEDTAAALRELLKERDAARTESATRRELLHRALRHIDAVSVLLNDIAAEAHRLDGGEAEGSTRFDSLIALVMRRFTDCSGLALVIDADNAGLLPHDVTGEDAGTGPREVPPHG